jgi:uncharacterized membrane protein
MDLAYLGAQMAAEDTNKERLAAAAGAVAAVTILDVLTSQKLSDDDHQTQSEHGMLSDWTGAAGDGVAQRRVHVVRSIPVNKPVDEVYQFWRNFENFPRFMYHLEEVRTEGDRRSHWKAKAPLGRTVEWDAEITEDRAGERICWRSLPGADVTNSGNVTFRKAPGDRGTYVTIELGYDPPGGVVGATIAKLFGREPAQQVDHDLRRFKAVLETGEVIQSDATAKGWGAARPPSPPHRR